MWPCSWLSKIKGTIIWRVFGATSFNFPLTTCIPGVIYCLILDFQIRFFSRMIPSKISRSLGDHWSCDRIKCQVLGPKKVFPLYHFCHISISKRLLKLPNDSGNNVYRLLRIFFPFLFWNSGVSSCIFYGPCPSVPKKKKKRLLISGQLYGTRLNGIKSNLHFMASSAVCGSSFRP